MPVQHPKEAMMLSRVRFLSEPNRSNQMMLKMKAGTTRQTRPENVSEIVLTGLPNVSEIVLTGLPDVSPAKKSSLEFILILKFF